MALVSESDNELIEQVMDCGSDDILLKPLDAGQLQ
jgi:AmiR/NasT family two-component response regulator